MKALPQLNGNSPEDFQQAYVALRDTMDAAAKALRLLESSVTHARNYQHLEVGRGVAAAIADRRWVHQHLIGAMGSLGQVASALSDTLEDTPQWK